MWILILVIISVGLLYLAYSMTPRITNNMEYFDYDWSNRWSDMDRKARAGHDCRPVYKVQRMLGEISTWIWMVPATCEQGLPHTRGIDVIALPVDLPKPHVARILAHEKIHLLQRMYGPSWKRFYRQKWNYEIYSEPPVGMPPDLITRRRGNPDTTDEPWCCWNRVWWPVAVYKEPLAPTLKDTVIQWWNSETGTIQVNAPDNWLEFFGRGIHQNEHPHEITAEFLSGPLYNNSEPSNPSPAMLILQKNWTADADAPLV